MRMVSLPRPPCCEIAFASILGGSLASQINRRESAHFGGAVISIAQIAAGRMYMDAR